ncbi:MAG: two-component sensor histidine kinase [Magnetovibrio sp.]|nr:two-component sensor histidine kinase [Magnetovibrio sp.]
MSQPTAPNKTTSIKTGGVTPDLVLNALSQAVLVLSHNDQVQFANLAAEHLFSLSSGAFARTPLTDLIPQDSPVFALIDQVRGGVSTVTEHRIVLDTPRTGQRTVNVQVSELLDGVADHGHKSVILSLQERSIADQIAHRLTHRDSARSMSAMSSMLAHEVKNPLSGIRGAAQLLEQGANDADRELTRLIQDESDRIKDLIERMELFSENAPLKTGPLNIHQVLDRVHKVAAHGFAKSVSFKKSYDPSLPPVLGHRDQLIQVFLNLVKNAAEAVAPHGGEIVLKTAYQHGISFAMPGQKGHVHLPLAITVQDNGPGIPDDLSEHLFDPFVTTKANGSGLGLAMVAKIVDDLGGVIDFETQSGRTSFRVLLPMSKDPVPEGQDV